jgi:opacity protein-like surface antigen
MRKSVLSIAVVAVVFLAAWPSTARAQQGLLEPLRGKVFASVNFGIQVGDNNLGRESSFDLYDETATVEVNQTINNGAFLEFAGAYKVRDDLGVGLAYHFVTNSGDGTISGSLPHPQLFDQPRTFSASVEDLAHTEHAVHFQAVWFVPFTDKVDFTISGGPSIFNVKQGLIRSVAFSENPPNFTSVTIDSVEVIELSDSAWGFHLGADMTYALTPSIGVGALIRYSHGTVEFNLSDSQTADVTAGGFQIGGGVRLKF